MKTEIKWGLIFSLVSLLWLILEFMAGWHDRHIAWHPILTNLFIVPAVTMMYLAVREKRRTRGGRINFQEAFLCGLGVSVIVAILSPLAQYLFHRFINPHYFEKAIEYTVSSGKATAELAHQLFNLQSYMLQASLGALVAGVLTSLVLAALMRDKQST